MHFRTLLQLATAAVVVRAAAVPTILPRATCDTVEVRKEWRNLTSTEQQAYLDAAYCLVSLPSQTDTLFPNVTNRWMDFAAVHQNLTPTIHNDGIFLPWHRLFQYSYFTALKTECAYAGVIPWWDESIDAGAFAESPLLTAETFGSGGVGDLNCVEDGRWANTTLYIGPGDATQNTVHCMSRNIDEVSSAGTSATVVDKCNALDTYQDMWQCVFPMGPHGNGHFGVGGTMADVSASPVDPLFFMHHGFIDHNWWTWQNLNATRLTDLGADPGYTTEVEPATGWVDVSLDYVLSVWGLVPNATVGSLMDTTVTLCYTYDY